MQSNESCACHRFDYHNDPVVSADDAPVITATPELGTSWLVRHYGDALCGMKSTKLRSATTITRDQRRSEPGKLCECYLGGNPRFLYPQHGIQGCQIMNSTR
jgi:hypothetical protein